MGPPGSCSPGLGAAGAGPGQGPSPRGSGSPCGATLRSSPPPQVGVLKGRRRRRGPGGKLGPRVRRPGMTRAPPPGLLELSPVERGVVSIFGVASRFFVAMSSRGRLYGSVSTVGPAEPGSIVTLPGRPTPGSWSCGGGRGIESNPHPEAGPVALVVQSLSPVGFLWRSHRPSPARLHCPWDVPGQNPGVGGCVASLLLQGIFLSPGIQPASPALAGGFFTTAPPGMPSQPKAEAQAQDRASAPAILEWSLASGSRVPSGAVAWSPRGGSPWAGRQSLGGH